jgi:hypothetical protein
MPRFLLWLSAAVALGLAHTAAAIEAHRLAPDEKIVLDGRLDEPAWQRAPLLDRFWDVSPQDKQPARVRTEARFAYDRQALYVAVWAYDPDPAKLRAPFARRDNVLSDQDMVVLFVDPVGNRKFAHFFRVNPRGSIGDGLYNEDTSNEDFSPDLDFDVATGRFEGGWTVEFRIPFSSLRYTDPPSKQWSVMLYRVWPREQQYRISSSMLPREQTCFLCLNEPLTGLDDLPATRHLELTPNVTLREVRNRDAGRPERREGEVVPSLDLKWRPRADVIVDGTVNPDFSQVELDTPQLAGNTQFALFFPEKRPFFLEGSDILQSPFPAIYTRSVTDPAWGARVTQRTQGFDGTAMVTRDQGGGLVLLPGTYSTGTAAQDFSSIATFARGRWQADRTLSIGGLFTDRTIERDHSYNRVAGPDFAWYPNNDNRFRGQLLGSWTTAQPVNGTLERGELATSHAAMVDWSFHSARWDQYLTFEDTGSAFRADNGFFVQNGYRRAYSETARKFLDQWGFNEVTPYANLEYRTNRDGDVQYQQNTLGLRLGLPRATMFWFELRPNNLVAVQPGPPRKRDQLYAAFESNPFAWLAKIHTEFVWGDRLDVANNRIGQGSFVTLQLSMRPHARFELEYRIDNDIVNSREATVGSNLIIGQRVQQVVSYWHFTARDSVRLIWQDVRVHRSPSLWTVPVAAREASETVSVVYGKRIGIGKSFYVGTTYSRNRVPDFGVKSDQLEVFTKASWSFDVL